MRPSSRIRLVALSTALFALHPIAAQAGILFNVARHVAVIGGTTLVVSQVKKHCHMEFDPVSGRDKPKCEFVNRGHNPAAQPGQAEF